MQFEFNQDIIFYSCKKKTKILLKIHIKYKAKFSAFLFLYFFLQYCNNVLAK